jgi:hypothetical protein
MTTRLRQDMDGFDKLFGLPGPQMRVVTSLAGSASPGLSYGEETATAAALAAMLKMGIMRGAVI